MTRVARKKSEAGIYHIMARGINRQSIFLDDEDYLKFLKIVKINKEKDLFDIFGYCLMGNHLHLLFQEHTASLSIVMQRILSSFVGWYNRKYDRLGHLFQERFKSEPVEDESYLLTLLRYIHQNPLKSGIINTIAEYKWSSYHEYIEAQNSLDIADTEFILKIFSEENEIAKMEFKDYMDQPSDSLCLDYHEQHRLTDNFVIKIIKDKYGIDIGQTDLIKKQEMDKILKNLKAINGITIRQISRVTGISKYWVEKV